MAVGLLEAGAFAASPQPAGHGTMATLAGCPLCLGTSTASLAMAMAQTPMRLARRMYDAANDLHSAGG